MTKTIEFTRKIGQNRGKSRLWIEGKHLIAAGLAHGTRWTLTPTDTGLTIQADPEGRRRIAGGPTRPVVDIVGASLGVVGQAAQVSVTYEPGSGRMEVGL